MWKNREHIEEILFLLDTFHWPPTLQQQSTADDAELAVVFGRIRDKLQNTLKALETFQATNAERVFNTVMTYMPQDFRGTLIKQQRERSERNKQAEVDALINSGGSIRDRYGLLWKQQMDRRKQLAQLGSATGVFKTLVKYLVGVPQVLLDFLRQINDDDGPMEEQRHRYGPSLYSLTTMVLFIRLFLLLALGRFEAGKLKGEKVAILELAVDVYATEFVRFITFIREVFANSPFFISAEEAGALDARKNDDYKEISVPAGKSHEVLLSVDAINSYIAWDFSVIQGKITVDIGFSVEYTNPSGEKSLILPYRRYESDQGNFCTVMAGNYKLIWDNSYANFFKKVLRYKVDCIPPVVEPSPAETQVEE
ncbi:GOLD domain containing protein [Trema orientale]|uniref:GOLD domain containing protein n=1 Tax=Trema orientale TaxID=63057 RepID=A0A2P5CVC4_TREOI|nr:GOLD domain containing protein [Trema orientale]